MNEEVFTENPDEIDEKHVLVVPDKFLKGTAQERVWGLVFNNRRKLKDLAADLSRASVLLGFSRRDIKILPPEQVVKSLLTSLEIRRSLFGDRKIDFSQSHWVSILKACHARIVKKSGHSCAVELEMDLSSYNIDIEGKEYADDEYLKIIINYTSQPYYESLQLDDRDCADFVVNCLLNEICDPYFTRDFLEKHLWFKEKNTILHKNVCRIIQEREESESRNIFPDESKFDRWYLECLSSLGFEYIGAKLRLKNFVNISCGLQDLLYRERLGLRTKIQQYLEIETSVVVSSITHSIQKLSACDLVANGEEWNLCRDISKEIDGTSFEFDLITNDLLSMLREYCGDCNQFVDLIGQAPEEMAIAFDELLEIKRQVAAEASKPDSNVQILIEKSLRLKEVDSAVTELSKQASSGFLTILSRVKKMCDDFTAITSIKPEEVPEQLSVAIQPESSPEVKFATVSVDSQEHSLIEGVKSELAYAIGELNAAKEKLSKAIDKQLVTEEKLTEAKRVNHQLRLRLESSGKSSEDASGSLKIDQGLMRGLVTRRSITPVELLRFYQSMDSDRVEILPSAMKSAKDSDNFELGDRLAILLDNLIYPYLDSLREGNPDAEARKILGSSYAAKESEAVMTNKRLRSMREFAYDGETVEFMQHVSIGQNYGTARAIRIYFKVIDNKIVIGHCGAFFEVVSTN